MKRGFAGRRVSVWSSRRLTPLPPEALERDGSLLSRTCRELVVRSGALRGFFVASGKRVCGRVEPLEGLFRCLSRVGGFRRVVGAFSWLVGASWLGERVLPVRVFGVYDFGEA